MMQIHERIKNERLKANLTEEEMAERLHIGRSTYQYWEKKTPNIDKIEAVAQALNLPKDYFFINNDEIIEVNNHPAQPVRPLKFKTASGETINIIPEGNNDIMLLNALFEERERIISEKEQRQKDAEQRAEKAEKEKDRLLTIIEKNLTELLTNSRELKENFANSNTEMQVEHYAIMGALDQIQGNQPGTLAAKAGKAEHDLKEAIKEGRKKHSLSKPNKSH
jgi:transcriptional regulator with XRE-family HTH domain